MNFTVGGIEYTISAPSYALYSIKLLTAGGKRPNLDNAQGFMRHAANLIAKKWATPV